MRFSSTFWSEPSSRAQISSLWLVIPLTTMATVATTRDRARISTKVAPSHRGTRHRSSRSASGTRMAANTAAIANGMATPATRAMM